MIYIVCFNFWFSSRSGKLVIKSKKPVGHEFDLLYINRKFFTESESSFFGLGRFDAHKNKANGIASHFLRISKPFVDSFSQDLDEIQPSFDDVPAHSNGVSQAFIKN